MHEPSCPRPLYIRRELLNGLALVTWASSQGLSIQASASLHVTIAYSRTPVPWVKVERSTAEVLIVTPGDDRRIGQLGDRGAIALIFTSQELSDRHRAIRRNAGASWDFDAYRPHVTLVHSGEAIDLASVQPFRGELIFGPEIFAEIGGRSARDQGG